MPPVQVVIAGRYAVGEELGRGGVGRVYAGHDRRLDRRVAIKLVSRRGIDPAGRQRFVREARAAAGIAHRNVVAVYDAGETDDELYLVMELVEGPSLAWRLTDEGPLPVPEAVRIAAEVLAALDVAHRAGVVHRDVKPGNILLTPAGEAKLADFGIAKRFEQETAGLTSPGDVVGTPRYVAPEQIAGEEVTEAADVYAVGVVLYEMLAGSPPFDGPTPLATALAHRDAPIPDLAAARPDAPPALVDAVTTAMAKDPADRHPSAAAMRAVLLAAVPALGEPPAVARALTPPAVLAPPVAPTEVMASPPPQRARPRWWVWAAAALLLVGGLVAVAAQRDGATGPAGAATTTARPRRSTTTAAAATPAPTPPPTAPPTTPPPTPPPTTAPPPPAAPTTVGDLIALLEADPGSFGERGPELLDRLRKVDEESGRKQADEAEKALDELGEWVEEGELDAGIAELAVSILAPIADHPGNGQGGGEDDEKGDD